MNGGSLYDFYATKDGRYISIGPLEPKSWQGFCELIEHPEWAKLGAWPDDTEAIKVEIQAIIASRDLTEWQQKLAGKDVCVEPVINMQELLESEYIKAREMIVDVPLGDRQSVGQIGFPIKFSASPVAYKHAGYEIRRDNQAVLSALGYNAATLDHLGKEGVFT